MGTLIPLESIPTQSLTIAPDDHSYDMVVRTLQNGICVMDISRDGEVLTKAARCVPGYYVMRYQYQEADSGNFVWSTPDDEYPDHTKFGVTHFLYFVPIDELEAFRNA